jgi:hypothetical protein
MQPVWIGVGVWLSLCVVFVARWDWSRVARMDTACHRGECTCCG